MNRQQRRAAASKRKQPRLTSSPSKTADKQNLAATSGGQVQVTDSTGKVVEVYVGNPVRKYSTEHPHE